MPTCKKCFKTFKTYIVVDGAGHNVSKRKYCLECSPFGKHNTVQLHIDKNTKVLDRVCERCGKGYTYSKIKGHGASLCNSCITKTRHRTAKTRLVELFGGKCQICGYNKCVDVLNFHHKDPHTKSFGIGKSYNRSWKVLLEESKKCILLCANCHGEVHSRFGEQGELAQLAARGHYRA